MCAVELYWLPLGAGGRFVAFNGRAYERIVSLAGRRRARPLFHSALIVDTGADRYTIELCPEQRGDHGRVAGGAVGARWAGRSRLFRYEARCWRGGTIPDLKYAVGGPSIVSEDGATAERIIELTGSIPTPVWGRDELGAGEMWNSNSVIAWLLERAGLDASAQNPPDSGRAPGWNAGIVVARAA